MNYVFNLVVLLSIIAGCFSEDKLNNKQDDEEGYIENPDNFAEIERPCHVYDLNCIRKFFANHAHCDLVDGPLPDSLFRSVQSYYFSRGNTTIMQLNMRITGFRNTRIEEFYINRATNKVVFSIEARSLSFVSPSIYLVFYRRGREPVTVLSENSASFPSLTFTAVIPNIDDMQLDRAEVTTYVAAPLAPFTLGPELVSIPDPVVIANMAELVDDVPADIQEFMFTDGLFYLPQYIQNTICDFGLKIV